MKKIKTKKVRKTESVNHQTESIRKVFKKPEIVRKKVGDLKPSPYNPRKISDSNLQGLEKSLETWGNLQPIIWNRAKDRIVGGHQRLRVLQKNGVEDVDVVVVDIEDENEEKALNLALNNPAIAGEFTQQSLDILEDVRDFMPDQYDSVNLRELHDMILGKPPEEFTDDKEDKAGEKDNGIAVPNMDLQPFEHYDYLLVLATDSRDWQNLCEKLGIQKVNCSPIAGHKKIGLGRCIHARRLLALLDQDKKKEESE